MSFIIDPDQFDVASAGSSDLTVALSGVASPTGFGGNVVAVHVWRGADQTTPIDATTTTASGSNTGQANPPAITPVTTGAVVVSGAVGGCSTLATPFTSSDLSNFISAAEGAANGAVAVGLGSKAWSGSGAVDPAQFGGADTGIGNSWCAATTAVRAASGQTLTYVGGTTAQNTDHAAFSVDLTSLAGGSDSAPQVGDLILVVYGIGLSGSQAISVTTAGYTQIASAAGTDTVNTEIRMAWKIAA